MKIKFETVFLIDIISHNFTHLNSINGSNNSISYCLLACLSVSLNFCGMRKVFKIYISKVEIVLFCSVLGKLMQSHCLTKYLSLWSIFINWIVYWTFVTFIRLFEIQFLDFRNGLMNEFVCVWWIFLTWTYSKVVALEKKKPEKNC